MKRYSIQCPGRLCEWGGVTTGGKKMKKKVVNAFLNRNNCRIPMNLQFFAEPPTDPPIDPPADPPADPEPPTFDDLLAGGHQAEFDRRVQQSIQTALTKAEDKWKTLADEKATEADKLAKMNVAEKAEYEAKKKAKELEEREAGITKRELQATAKVTLADKKLPVELADVLVYSDADSCSGSIEVVEKAFQAAIEAAVEERLKGGDPLKKAPENQETLTAQVEKAIMGNI